VASGYGSKPDWSAFGGHGASLGHVEVVVWFRWRLVLDVVNPHLIRHVAAAHNPVAPRPQTLANLHLEAPRSHPPKGVGFPDPLSGTLNELIRVCSDLVGSLVKPAHSNGIILRDTIAFTECNPKLRLSRHGRAGRASWDPANRERPSVTIMRQNDSNFPTSLHFDNFVYSGSSIRQAVIHGSSILGHLGAEKQ
jgi:hypothetical protein